MRDGRSRRGEKLRGGRSKSHIIDRMTGTNPNKRGSMRHSIEGVKTDLITECSLDKEDQISWLISKHFVPTATIWAASAI